MPSTENSSLTIRNTTFGRINDITSPFQTAYFKSVTGADQTPCAICQ